MQYKLCVEFERLGREGLTKDTFSFYYGKCGSSVLELDPYERVKGESQDILASAAINLTILFSLV